jgi:hypothetical protein
MPSYTKVLEIVYKEGIRIDNATGIIHLTSDTGFFNSSANEGTFNTTCFAVGHGDGTSLCDSLLFCSHIEPSRIPFSHVSFNPVSKDLFPVSLNNKTTYNTPMATTRIVDIEQLVNHVTQLDDCEKEAFFALLAAKFNDPELTTYDHQKIVDNLISCSETLGERCGN